jgi:hypothetical protein
MRSRWCMCDGEKNNDVVGEGEVSRHVMAKWGIQWWCQGQMTTYEARWRKCDRMIARSWSYGTTMQSEWMEAWRTITRCNARALLLVSKKNMRDKKLLKGPDPAARKRNVRRSRGARAPNNNLVTWEWEETQRTIGISVLLSFGRCHDGFVFSLGLIVVCRVMTNCSLLTRTELLSIS